MSHRTGNREKLLDELAEYRRFFEEAPFGLHSLDRNGNFLEVNQAWLNLTGYSRDEVLGRWFGEFLWPGEQEKFRENFFRFKEAGVARGVEFTLRRKDGRPLLASVEGRVLHDEQGNFQRTLCTLRDIGEQRQHQRIQEAALALSRLYLSDSSLENTLRDVPSILASHFRVPIAAVEIYDREREEMVFTGAHGIPSGAGGPLRVPVGQTLSGVVAKTGEALWEADASQRPEYSSQALKRLGVRAFWCAPLTVKERILGTLSLADTLEREDGEALLAPLQAVANHLAQEIDRKKTEESLRRALEETRKRQNEVAALFQGSRALLRDEDFRSTAESLFYTCRNLIGAQAGYVALLSENGKENEVLFLEPGGYPCSVDPSLPMPIRGMRAEAYAGRKPVYRNDFPESPWARYLPPGHVTLENVLFAPLLDGQSPVGVIGLANKPGGFTASDVPLAMAFAEFASVALRRSRSREALRESEARYRKAAERMSLLASISRIISSTLNLEEVYSKLCEEMGKVLPFDGIRINLVQPGKTEGVVVFAAGTEVSGRGRGDAFSLAGSVTEAALQNGRALLISTEEEKELAGKYPGLLPGFRSGLRSFLVVPLRSNERVAGTLIFHARKPSAFSEADLDLGQAIGDQIAGAIYNAKTYWEQKKAEEALRESERRLRQAQKLEAIGTLAGGIAHDFNNILASIMGYAEMSLYASRERSIQQNLDQVLKAALRAKDLVKQILTFSRQGEQQLKPVVLAPILKETAKMLRASLPRTIDIRLNIRAPRGVILADATQIHQVLLNLAANASHAMREKGGRLEISLQETTLTRQNAPPNSDLSPGPYLHLTVRDTGEGISPGVLDRIFEPYFTTKPPGRGRAWGWPWSTGS